VDLSCFLPRGFFYREYLMLPCCVFPIKRNDAHPRHSTRNCPRQQRLSESTKNRPPSLRKQEIHVLYALKPITCYLERLMSVTRFDVLFEALRQATFSYRRCRVLAAARRDRDRDRDHLSVQLRAKKSSLQRFPNLLQTARPTLWQECRKEQTRAIPA